MPWRSQPAPSLSSPRFGARAEMLLDGRVLVVGGFGGRKVEIFDPQTNTFAVVAELGAEPLFHSTCVLADGRVMSIGGKTATATVADVEIVDPVRGTVERAAPLRGARQQAAAIRLRDGRVLVAGGFAKGRLASAEVFDPGKNHWTDVSPMKVARDSHSLSELPDGRVVAAGGLDADNGKLASCEIFDPATGTWAPGPKLGKPRHEHVLVSLSDGTLVVTGGWLGSVEAWAPGKPGFAVAGESKIKRGYHAATALVGDRVLVLGGYDGKGSCGTTEIWTKGTLVAGPKLAVARQDHAALRLRDGRVLVIAGRLKTAKERRELADCELLVED